MNINRIRRAKGLTQVQLAELMNVTQPTISRLERGDEGTTLGQYKSCAIALSVTVSDLFGDSQSILELRLLETFRKVPVSKRSQVLSLLELASALAGERNQ